MSYFIYFQADNFPNYYLRYTNQKLDQREQLNYYPHNFSLPSSYYKVQPTFISNTPQTLYYSQNSPNDHNVEPVQSPPMVMPSDQTPQKKKQRRGANEQKVIESAKKNSESNLVNSFFSFYSNREHSQGNVRSILRSMNCQEGQQEKLQQLFFTTITIYNFRRGRNYVNKTSLLALGNIKKLLEAVPELKDKIQKLQDQVPVENLCLLFRICCNYFFKVKNISAVLTSKRITKLSRIHHLQRRRKIVGYYEKKFK